MKDEIKQFQKQNGNINYSVKELIGALHIKMDNLDSKFNDGNKKIVVNRIKINTLTKVFYGAGTIMVAVTGWIVITLFTIK